MITAAIYILCGVTSIALIFLAITSLRGPRFAFLAICWLPLGGLFLAVGAHHHVGYSMLGVLPTIVVASIAIAGLGVMLSAKALREKTAILPLIVGTLVAASPLVIMLARS